MTTHSIVKWNVIDYKEGKITRVLKQYLKPENNQKHITACTTLVHDHTFYCECNETIKNRDKHTQNQKNNQNYITACIYIYMNLRMFRATQMDKKKECFRLRIPYVVHIFVTANIIQHHKLTISRYIYPSKPHFHA